ncbi:MAG: hydroxyisourate hydrolase, partial [Klebsiella aerogenes]
MITLSTHILDISTGKPAQGVAVTLLCEGRSLASGVTDSHGRLGELATGQLRPGNYQLVAELQSWFARDGRQTLYRQAQIDFMITAEDKD